MKNILKTIWNALWHRSPHNATQSQVSQHPVHNWPVGGPSAADQVIETLVETECLGPIELGEISQACQKADGELSQSSRKLIIVAGCNHIVTQFQPVQKQNRHIRGIAGQCEYCLTELGPLYNTGQISPYDFFRLSLVCTDCAHMTTSGYLSCPKHYTMVTQTDGTTVYLGPAEAKELRRRNTIHTVKNVLLDLFREDESGDIQ